MDFTEPTILFSIDDLESQLTKKIGASSSQVSMPTTTTSTIRTCSMPHRLLPPPQEKITITTTAQKRSGCSLEQPEVKKLKLGMDIARNASIACGHLDALELAQKMAPPADLEKVSLLTSQFATGEANTISLPKMKTPEIVEQFQSSPHFKDLLSDEVVAAYFKGKVKMQQQIYQVL